MFPQLLIGSALANSVSILDLDGIGSVRHGESCWKLLTEVIPVVPSLPKPRHVNPIQQSTQLGRTTLCQIIVACHFWVELYFSYHLWPFKIYSNLRDAIVSVNYFSMRGLKVNIKIPVGTDQILDHTKQYYYCCLKGYNLESVCIIWPLSLISLICIILDIIPITPISINYSLYTCNSVIYFRLHVRIS